MSEYTIEATVHLIFKIIFEFSRKVLSTKNHNVFQRLQGWYATRHLADVTSDSRKNPIEPEARFLVTTQSIDI